MSRAEGEQDLILSLILAHFKLYTFKLQLIDNVLIKIRSIKYEIEYLENN